MAFIPAVVAVSFYFDKRRTIAIGIAVCGTGIGTFAIAPLTNALLLEYSWKGTVLIEGAMLLNCITCGMVFWPLNINNGTAQDTPPIEEIVLTSFLRTDEPRISISTIESPHAMHDVKCRQEGFSDLEKATVSRLDKYWSISFSITNEQEEKPMNIEGSKKQEMIVINAANLELSPMTTTSSRTVECTRQHNEWEKSAMLCASSMHVASLTLRKNRSFSSISQCQGECGNYVHSTLSQSQSQLNKWLAKIDITVENGGEVPNVTECEQTQIKVKGASNLELSCTSSTSSLDVECEQQFSKFEKSTIGKEGMATVEVESGQPEMTDITAANVEPLGDFTF